MQIRGLISKPFIRSYPWYLTRLETRIEPAAITEDIEFVLDRKPKSFRVHSEGTVAAANARDIVGFIVLPIIILVVGLGLPIFGLTMLVRWIVRLCRSARKARSRHRDCGEQSRREGPDSHKAT